MEQWNGIVEWWNGGIVEWVTMTNDPAPHQFIRACAHYAAQLQQTVRKARENIGQGCRFGEAKSTEHILIV